MRKFILYFIIYVLFHNYILFNLLCHLTFKIIYKFNYHVL